MTWDKSLILYAFSLQASQVKEIWERLYYHLEQSATVYGPNEYPPDDDHPNSGTVVWHLVESPRDTIEWIRRNFTEEEIPYATFLMGQLSQDPTLPEHYRCVQDGLSALFSSPVVELDTDLKGFDGLSLRRGKQILEAILDRLLDTVGIGANLSSLKEWARHTFEGIEREAAFFFIGQYTRTDKHTWDEPDVLLMMGKAWHLTENEYAQAGPQTCPAHFPDDSLREKGEDPRQERHESGSARP